MSSKTVLICIVVLCSCALLIADDHGKVAKFSTSSLLDPQWSKDSKYEDSYYIGNIVTKMKISALNGGGLAHLYKYFKDTTAGQATTKSWGEKKAFFEVDAGRKLDAVTRQFVSDDKNDQGEIKMQLMCYLAYEKGKQVVYYSKLEKVLSATGGRKRIKDFSVYLQFTKSQTPGYYDVHVRHYYKIESYWYEPTNRFVSAVREKILKSFVAKLPARAQKWANNL